MCMCLSVCKNLERGGGGGRKGVRQGQDRIILGEEEGLGVGMLFDFEGQWVGSFLKIKK